MNLHHAATAVLSYAFQSAFLLAVGLILPTALRLRHPRTLLVYWRVLLIAVLLLPLAPLEWVGETSLPYIELDGLQVEAAVNTALPSTLPDFSWKAGLAVVASVAMLGIVRLILGLGYLHACRRQAQPLSPAPASVTGIQERLGLDVPFLISSRLTTPLTFGWLRPAVLLPDTFRDLSSDQQEGVACHELLHVRRRDWLMTFFEELVRAVVWFHPAVWLVLPRISLSREQVVDADTVRLTGKRRQYLEALWRVICSDRSSVATVAVPFLARRDLIDRVASLHKEITMSKTRIACTMFVLAFVIPAVAVFGASVFRTEAPTELSAPEWSAGGETEKQQEKQTEPKLETVSADSLCDEITHPVVIEKITPKYPSDAREEKVMGMVIVETVITEEGVVEEIRVLESPDERLTMAAVEAIKRWHFDPALCDGEPVAVYYNLTINFRLE